MSFHVTNQSLTCHTSEYGAEDISLTKTTSGILSKSHMLLILTPSLTIFVQRKPLNDEFNQAIVVTEAKQHLANTSSTVIQGIQ